MLFTPNLVVTLIVLCSVSIIYVVVDELIKKAKQKKEEYNNENQEK